mgnify:FL=1
MAYTINRALITPCNAQTINATATYTSAEQDLGDDKIFSNIWLYVEVTGYAAAPAGNKRLIVKIAPVHTKSGDAFSDGAASYPCTVTADQAYRFAWPVASLPRYFKVLVTNDTDKNTDANAVTVKIEYTEESV